MDDMLVLAIFFGQSKANPALKKRHVVMGQYLGFLVVVLASLLVFLTSLVIPPVWIGLLGFFPIGQGVFRLMTLKGTQKQAPEQRYEPQEDAAENDQASSVPRFLRRLFNPRMYSIAMITIGNGSDNISIYPPLFAHGGYGQLIVILVLFFLMVAVWCVLGNLLTHVPGIAHLLERYGPNVLPLCLIGLGIFILVQSGTWELFAQLIVHHERMPACLLCKAVSPHTGLMEEFLARLLRTTVYWAITSFH
jgi:cadmium resistance protein CadD (predicted permease)